MLWDVDYTLVGADGLGTRLYEVVFREMFGRELKLLLRGDNELVCESWER